MRQLLLKLEQKRRRATRIPPGSERFGLRRARVQDRLPGCARGAETQGRLSLTQPVGAERAGKSSAGLLCGPAGFWADYRAVSGSLLRSEAAAGGGGSSDEAGTRAAGAGEGLHQHQAAEQHCCHGDGGGTHDGLRLQVSVRLSGPGVGAGFRPCSGED